MVCFISLKPEPMKTFWNETEFVTNQNISAEGIVNLNIQCFVKQ